MKINEALDHILSINGAVAASIVDANSGMMFGSKSIDPSVDLELASASNTELYNSELRIMETLNIKENIDDFLISLESQYHILVPVAQVTGVFIYYIGSMSRGTLAMARRTLKDVASKISL